MSSAVFDGRYPVELDKTRYILISLNVLDDMQERFGSIDNLGAALDKKNPDMIKNLRWLLATTLNEGREDGEPELTERQVGHMIHTGNLNAVTSSFMKAFSRAVPKDEAAASDEEDDASGGEAEAESEEGKKNPG